MCNPRTGQTNKQLFQPIPYLKKKKRNGRMFHSSKKTKKTKTKKKNKKKKKKKKKRWNLVNESSITSQVSTNWPSPIGFLRTLLRCIRNRYRVTLSPRVHAGLAVCYWRTNNCSWASASPFLFAKGQ